MRPTLITAERVRTAQGIAGDAVLVGAGRVQSVGWATDLRRNGLVEERYPGATIVAGLGDAHFHPSGYTAAITRLNVDKAESHDDIVMMVRSAATQLDPTQPIIGTRLDDEHLAEGRLPDRITLDHATDRPVFLYRYCGHVAVASTAALAAAGIDHTTPDPPGGIIDRDDSGVPTGILRETAVDLVAAAIGDRATGQTPDELNSALRGLVRQGLTRLGAIIRVGQGVWCGVGDELELLVAAAPELPLDLSVFVIADSPADLEAAAVKLNNAGRRISFAGMKAYSDGSLGGKTAAMFEPYADAPDQVGTARFDRAIIDPVARTAIDLGGGVAIHAIGDRANRDVLDYLASLRQDHSEALLRLEHASVLAPEDFARFRENDVVASVQPAFLASETDWLERRLGPDRLKRTYAFRTLELAGARLAGGSDCPVEPPNPLLGMATAIDRCGIVPGEALSPSSALGMFTDGVSTALGLPAPLAEGSRAHLTLLDRDPVDSSPEELRHTGVVATWIDGASVAADADALVWA